MKLPRDFKPIKPGPELAKLIDEAPEQVLFPLGYFIERFAFDPEQIRQELIAGRLVAETKAKTLRNTKTLRANNFVISLAALRAWLRHPQTPPHLIVQILRAMAPPS